MAAHDPFDLTQEELDSLGAGQPIPAYREDRYSTHKLDSDPEIERIRNIEYAADRFAAAEDRYARQRDREFWGDPETNRRNINRMVGWSLAVIGAFMLIAFALLAHP